MKEALPKEWKNEIKKSTVVWIPGNSDHPGKDWLKNLWEYIYLHFQNQLTKLKGLPIIPVRKEKHQVILAFLDASSKIIYGKCTIPSEIKLSLQNNFEVLFVENLPSYISHPQLKNFIYDENAKGVLNLLLDNVTPQKFCEFSQKSNDPQLSQHWCTFLSTANITTKQEKQYLKMLPIFQIKNKSSTESSIGSYSSLFPKMLQIEPDVFLHDQFPNDILYPQSYIDRDSNESVHLAVHLGCQSASLEEFLSCLLEKTHFKKHSNLQRDQLLSWILQRLHIYPFSQNFFDRLKNLPFIALSEQVLKSPKDLFDPGEEKLAALFLHEKKFPTEPYNNSDTLAYLRKLDLKKVPTIDEVLVSANLIQEANMPEKDALQKSDGVLYWIAYFFQQTPNLKASLKNQFQDIPFLTILTASPYGFPKRFFFHGASKTNEFICPSECTISSNKHLIGSSMPIFRNEIKEQKIIEIFSWNAETLKPEKVCEHLKNLVLKVNESESTFEERNYIKNYILKIYEWLKNNFSSEISLYLENSKWIWNGNDFSHPSEMIIESETLCLKPYKHSIPNDLLVFRDLFLSLGVNVSVSTADLVSILLEIQKFHLSNPNCGLNRSMQDLKLVIEILANIAEKEAENYALLKQLLVPTRQTEKILLLKPLKDCMYYEGEIDPESCISGFAFDDDHLKYFVVHEDITHSLAKSLRIETMRSLQINADEFGFEECGQREPLTQRIRNILEEYPDETCIFKELIQNADDAGANKIHFVIDLRKNSDSKINRLLDPEMAVCQGSALWAYNDAEFNESDFNNIQKLGGQTKKDVSEKIGRFGVGFNSVYHITDVPSFVSGKHVVFFDPYASHLKTHIKNKSRPGIKIDFVQNKHLHKFNDQFTPYYGLFGCHLGSIDQTKSIASFPGTLFRLPFRVQAPLGIAEADQMSGKIFDKEKILHLKNALKSNIDTLLLFTQNVCNVSLSIIPEDSQSVKNMINEFTIVKKNLLSIRKIKYQKKTKENYEEDSILELAAAALTNSEGNTLENHNTQSGIFEISKNIERQGEKKSFFLVTSCIGVAGAFEMAISDVGKKMGLLPCGGVATELDQSKLKDFYFPKRVNGELFCFLPMSATTGMPVHINGCFAVASNRRGLWQGSEKHDWKSSWNEELLKDSISWAYTKMLEDLKNLMPPFEDIGANDDVQKKLIDTWMYSYKKVFPPNFGKSEKLTDWEKLGNEVFLRMNTDQTRLFPVWKMQQSQNLLIEWFPLKRDKSKGPFFGPLCAEPQTLNKLIEMLLKLNFSLVHPAFDRFFSRFLNSELEVEKATPISISNFLRSCIEVDTECKLKSTQLPCKLEETQIGTEENLITLLTYCLKETSDNTERAANTKKTMFPLQDLPLLLTKDGFLRIFSKQQCVFGSYFARLAPKNADKFISEKFLDCFSKFNVDDLIKDFGMTDLSKYDSDVQDVKDFWLFLEERKKVESMDLKSICLLFSQWNVFPVKRTEFIDGKKCEYKFYITIGEAKTALVANHQKISKVLLKLGCLTFDADALNETSGLTVHDNKLSYTAMKFASSLNNYEGVIEVLKWVLDHQKKEQFNMLSKEEKLDILLHFEQDAEYLSPSSIQGLKKLPLFERLDGAFGDLQVPNHSFAMHILPSSIPVAGLENWTVTTNAIFLVEQPKLEKLYKVLGFTKISNLEAYLLYILPAFDHLSDEAALIHLTFLCQAINGIGVNKPESQKIIQKLRQTALIGSQGKRKLLSSFFDPRNTTFKVLLPASLLLPTIYLQMLEDYDFHDFYSLIGLQCILTEELFIQFATEVERASSTNPDDPDIEEKSKILTKELFEKENKWSKNLMYQIRNIRFIPMHVVEPDLLSLHKQYREHMVYVCYLDSVVYSEKNLVWSSADILPKWAVQERRLTEKSPFIHLGIKVKPSFELISTHCKNLCMQLCGQEISESSAMLLLKIMKGIYEALLTNIEEMSEESRQMLKNVPCIVVENGKKLVLPCQVSTEVKEQEKLSPYFYKLPYSLYSYVDLFLRIGATEQPTPLQYVKILQSLSEITHGKVLCPEEQRIVAIAGKGFFESFGQAWTIQHSNKPSNIVQIQKETQNISELYLLSVDNCLRKSTELIYNDQTKFKTRMANVTTFNHDQLHDTFVDLLIHHGKDLPSHLKPQIMSEIVAEVLTEEENCELSSVPCKLKNRLNLLISSPLFRQGLVRLVKHFCYKRDQKFSESLQSQIEAVCEYKVECKRRLNAILQNTHTNQTIEGSNGKVEFFLSKNGDIFISHEKVKKQRFIAALANKIAVEIQIFSEGTQIVETILNCKKPEEIQEELDDQNIKEEKNNHKDWLQPGSTIDSQFHSFLLQNPRHSFSEGEFVGYEICQNETDEDDGQYDAIFLLVRVLHEALSDNSQINSIWVKNI
jgi:sacsin